jgi:RES domain-containing protein
LWFEIELRDLPAHYRLLKIRAPENLVVEQVPPENLHADWTEQTAITRSRGDRWLDANNSALLRVPSVVVDARGVVVVQVTEHAIDPCLVKW